MYQFKEGDIVKCLVGEDWRHFETGELYEVTGLWYGGIDLGPEHRPVANVFLGDFVLVKDATHG